MENVPADQQPGRFEYFRQWKKGSYGIVMSKQSP